MKDRWKCKDTSGGQDCQLPHHQKLHGSSLAYCNVTRVMTATKFPRGPSVNGRIASLESSEEQRSPAPGEVGSFIIANLSAAPTYEEVREADQSYTLIPVQRVNTPLQNEGSMSIVTFFNAGSNISIVQTDWAKRAGLNGLPIIR